MTTTPAAALTMPTTVTQADIQAAAYTLGQVLRFNADALPFAALTEGWSVRLMLDQLAPPRPIAIGQGGAAGLIEAAIEDAVRLVGDDQALRLLAIELVARLLVKPEALPVVAGELSDLDDVRHGTGIGRQ